MTKQKTTLLVMQPGKPYQQISTATLLNTSIPEFHKWYVEQVALCFGVPLQYWKKND